LVRLARDAAQVLVFCDTIRHEQVQKQGVFGKMVHSPTQKSSKSSAQVRIRFERVKMTMVDLIQQRIAAMI
jgi:hypothetical protein